MDMNPRDMKRPEGVRISRSMDREEMADDMQARGDMQDMPPVRQRKSSKGPWVLVLTIVIVLAILGFVFRDRISGKLGYIGSEEYQAVFLTNGQVYFGKMANPDDRYIEMTDIYYLQVTPVLQTGTEGQPGAGQQDQQQQQLSLVKLGNELHGPVDRMHINRDQVLFFEDLKEDGRVVQAIREFKKNGNQ